MPLTLDELAGLKSPQRIKPLTLDELAYGRSGGQMDFEQRIETALSVAQQFLEPTGMFDAPVTQPVLRTQQPPADLDILRSLEQASQLPARAAKIPVEDPQSLNLAQAAGLAPIPEKSIGFEESIAEEFKRPAAGLQMIPIVGGIFGAVENLMYLDAAKRLRENYDYTKPIASARPAPGPLGMVPAVYGSRERDQKLVGDLILKMQDQQERGYSFGGKVAKGVMILPTWMVEFAATGGLANIGNKAVQKAGEKLLKNYAKTKAGEAALKAAGWTGGAIARGTVGLAPRVGEKAAQRQVGVQLLGEDQEGWASSFAKAWGDVVIESASEEAGAGLTKGAKFVLGKTGKLGKKLVPALESAWVKATGGTAGEFARRIATKGGYSNLLAEIGEERLGTILRAVTGVEDFGAGKDAGVLERFAAGLKEDAKNIGVEAVVLSVPMAGQVALGQTGRIAPPTQVPVSAPKPPQVTPVSAVTAEIEPTGIAPEARTGLPAVETVEKGAVQPAAAGVAAAKPININKRAEEALKEYPNLRVANWYGGKVYIGETGETHAHIAIRENMDYGKVVTGFVDETGAFIPQLPPDILAKKHPEYIAPAGVPVAEAGPGAEGPLPNYQDKQAVSQWLSQKPARPEIPSGIGKKKQWNIQMLQHEWDQQFGPIQKLPKRERSTDTRPDYLKRLEEGEGNLDDIQAVAGDILREKFGWPQRSAKSEAEYYEIDDDKRIRLAQHDVVYPESDVDLVISVGPSQDADIIIPEDASAEQIRKIIEESTAKFQPAPAAEAPMAERQAWVRTRQVTTFGPETKPRRRFQRGDTQQTLQAAFTEAKENNEPRYVFGTAGGLIINKTPPDFGQQHFEVLPTGEVFTRVSEQAAKQKEEMFADASKDRRREILQNRIKHGEDIGTKLLQEFADENWAQEALVKGKKAEGKSWESGAERPFTFDQNSTKNEGRFRLYPPGEIKAGTYKSQIAIKSRDIEATPGVRFILADAKSGGRVIQTIRFDKHKFTEQQAAEWWEQNKGKFEFYGAKAEAKPAAVTQAKGQMTLAEAPRSERSFVEPEAQPEVEAVRKKYYTSVPEEWRKVELLYDWGKKGLRGVRKGEAPIKSEGQRPRKTFIWRNEFDELPMRLPRETWDAIRARTDEIWPVAIRKHERFYLVPKQVVKEVQAKLGPDAFKRGEKPERSPRQMIQDRINSGERRDIPPDQIGEAIDYLAQKNGLTSEQLSDKANGYIQDYRNAKNSGKLTADIPERVEQAISPDEREERDAIQAEARDELPEAADIGDFLDRIVDEQIQPEKPRQKDLLGRPMLQGGATGTQGEFLEKEKFKTVAEQERINALQDIEGQRKFAAVDTLSKAEKDALRAQGYSVPDILKMTPEEARGKLAEPTQSQVQLDNFIKHVADPKMPAGTVIVPIPEVVQSAARKIGETAKRHAKSLKDDINEFRFYPTAPPEFRNAVRIDMIGALNKAMKNVYENAQEAIWGGLNKKDLGKSVEILFARDQLSRTKLGKGNPDISLKEAQTIFDNVMKDASPEAIAAADRFKTVHDAYTNKLITRGVLEEGQQIEDHVRHYVEDYTPEWAPYAGIPTRLKRPFRGYAKRAVGTRKTYRQDQEALLDSLLEMEYHNLVEDFIETQVARYDIKPSLSKEVRRELFGTDARGYTRVPTPGRIYIHEGKRYRAYTPDIPFSRAIYLTEKGEAALGSYKNVALILEDIYNLFRDFSQRGSRAVYLLNRATNIWKTMAILGHFPSFNINNFIGDTWIALVQHPNPLSLLTELETSIRYLTGRIEPEYAKQLDDFISKHDIKQTFTKAEMMTGRKMRKPLNWLLRKSYAVSDFRESIMRVAYASSLLRAQQRGGGDALVEAHDWIDTKGLSTEDALGKIGREVLADYQAVSKPFRRYIRGGIAPFGTWYIKMSSTVWKWFRKHPLKGLLIFMALPLAAFGYNRRRKEIQELEQQLPDYIRNRTHFILGENPDGTIRTLSLQLPQDVLIGTKIFSIVTDHANRVINDEMTPKEAALETLKTWGIREDEGVKYLLTPWIRMYSGLKTGKDPYDKAPVYRRDYRDMTWDEKAKDISAYILKTSVPFLGATIQTYEKGLPADVGFKKLADRLAGKGALGIYDINKKSQVVIEQNGQKVVVEFKDIENVRKISAQTYKYLGQIEDAWVASDFSLEQFITSNKISKPLSELYDIYSKSYPGALPSDVTENEKILAMEEALGERLQNRLMLPRVLQKRFEVQMMRAKTEEQKRQLAERRKETRQISLIETIKTLPKTERTIVLGTKIRKIFGDEEILPPLTPPRGKAEERLTEWQREFAERTEAVELTDVLQMIPSTVQKIASDVGATISSPSRTITRKGKPYRLNNIQYRFYISESMKNLRENIEKSPPKTKAGFEARLVNARLKARNTLVRKMNIGEL